MSSHEERLARLQQMRAEYLHHPDPKVQAMVANYALDFCVLRIEDVLHASFLAEIAINNAKCGRSMHAHENEQADDGNA